LEAANDLKLISFLGVECQAYIDVSTASQRGIKVCNTPGANAISVAEFAIALMLGAQRLIPQTVSSFINDDRPYPTTHIVHGKIVGLIGFGRIAQHVAKICHNGFGAHIQYWSKSGPKETAKKFDAKYVELLQLMATSDIISIHIPGSSNLVLDNALMEHVKPGALLVNTCPSRIFDPKALLKSLEKDAELRVAFDNFYSKEDEAKDPDITKLRSFIPERLQVTPHVAWRTYEADEATHAMAFDSISDFLSGRTPRHAVN
jgi:D-3-phosphoglycerate dehydrogenase / 2-oxoglutarate reductase